MARRSIRCMKVESLPPRFFEDDSFATPTDMATARVEFLGQHENNAVHDLLHGFPLRKLEEKSFHTLQYYAPVLHLGELIGVLNGNDVVCDVVCDFPQNICKQCEKRLPFQGYDFLDQDENRKIQSFWQQLSLDLMDVLAAINIFYNGQRADEKELFRSLLV